MSKKFLSGINVTGTATLNTVADAGSNTDKFLVLDASNNVSYRTAAELYIDLGIGALPAAYTSTLKHEVKASQTISKGQAVYVSSADGTNMIVSKASNVSEQYSSKTMGLLETSLVANGKGNVITEGLLSGLNTNGANAGDPVWLGVDGALIFGLANKPYAPAHLVFIGIVTRANANNGEIFVKVQNGFEMNELHNYQEGSVQNNQVIVYESSTSLYKPKTIPTILGYTPVPDSRTITINGTSYDLTANRAWTITTDASARTILRYVATANQTTFTISGGYTPGLTDVYRNGIKLDNETDFTATNGTTIVLTNGASVNDVIEVYRYQTAFLANNALRTVTEFVATAGQTTFNVIYNSGLVDVFYNGSKLLSTEYTAGNGTSIVLNFPCNLNDTLEVHAYSYQVGAFSGQSQLSGTGFVKVSGTTVTYDNSTYLTTSSASSTYLSLTGGTLTGPLGGTSAVFSSTLTNRGVILVGVSGSYATGDNPFIHLGGGGSSDTFGSINMPFADKMRFNSYHGFDFFTSNSGGSATPVKKISIQTNGDLHIGYVDTLNSPMILHWNGASSYGSIQTASSSYLTLNPGGNNVAIGAFNAPNKLSVANDFMVGAQGGNDYTYISGGSGYGSVIRNYYATGSVNNELRGNGNNYFNVLLGSMGVGTSNPLYTLDVNGTGRFTGKLYANTALYTTRIIGNNLVAGNIATNMPASLSYILILNINDAAGFSMSGKVNAASYTCWNISDIWVEKDYSSTTVRAGVEGKYKSGCDFAIVDINYGGGRYVAFRFTSNPEVDVLLTGYRLTDQVSNGEFQVITSGVTVNQIYAAY